MVMADTGQMASTPAARKPVLIVTGGSRGIGRETCLLAAAAGYSVVVNYRSDDAAAQSTVDQIQAAGGEARVKKADVTSETDVAELFKFAADTVGPIAALVNNAGIIACPAKGADIDMARFDRMVSVNLRGPFLCLREAARTMVKNTSDTARAIVNVSSYSVQTGGAFNHIDYAAAKAGVEAMTLGFARELVKSGIRVNAVSPGTTDTDMAKSLVGPRLEKTKARIPMGRLATPAEVADCIMFLLSPRAAYITGAVLPVHGGR
jgi:NAD(P)-dependent dehydrogenase (short-subunit alcohol dehydrogenase family)